MKNAKCESPKMKNNLIIYIGVLSIMSKYVIKLPTDIWKLIIDAARDKKPDKWAECNGHMYNLDNVISVTFKEMETYIYF